MVIEERLVHMLFCTKNPTWSTLGSNLSVLVPYSATYRLRYGAAASLFCLVCSKNVHLCIFEPEKQLTEFNPLNPELNPICYLLALLGAHHFLHVSRIRVRLLTFRRLMSYIYGAPILDVFRSHTTTQPSR